MGKLITKIISNYMVLQQEVKDKKYEPGYVNGSTWHMSTASMPTESWNP